MDKMTKLKLRNRAYEARILQLEARVEFLETEIDLCKKVDKTKEKETDTTKSLWAPEINADKVSEKTLQLLHNYIKFQNETRLNPHVRKIELNQWLQAQSDNEQNDDRQTHEEMCQLQDTIFSHDREITPKD